MCHVINALLCFGFEYLLLCVLKILKLSNEIIKMNQSSFGISLSVCLPVETTKNGLNFEIWRIYWSVLKFDRGPAIKCINYLSYVSYVYLESFAMEGSLLKVWKVLQIYLKLKQGKLIIMNSAFLLSKNNSCPRLLFIELF